MFAITNMVYLSFFSPIIKWKTWIEFFCLFSLFQTNLSHLLHFPVTSQFQFKRLMFKVFISRCSVFLLRYFCFGERFSFLRFPLELFLLAHDEYRFLMSHLLGEWTKSLMGPPILEIESTHSRGKSVKRDCKCKIYSSDALTLC